MAPEVAVILSPHLDDAVLSCWHLLDGPADVSVINVYSGSPPAGATLAAWDRASGASDSAVRMEERRVEDRMALDAAGRTAIHLDFLDAQYDGARHTVSQIVSALRDVVDPRTVVYAPAALGEHEDHERVRSAAVELAAAGQKVRLYADFPHAMMLGWPGWVDNTSIASGSEVGQRWDRRFREAGVRVAEPVVYRLNSRECDRKFRAVSAYRTQIAALRSAFGEMDGFPAFPNEIVWAVQ